MKGKDLKDYWEGDLGVSYIPHSKLRPDMDIEMLEDGGMVDEETMPAWMKAKVAQITPKSRPIQEIDMSVQSATNISNASAQLDTSQPPPVTSALIQPPPALALNMVPPFPLNQLNRNILGPVGINLPPCMLLLSII